MGLFGGFIDKFKKGLAKTKEVFTAPLNAAGNFRFDIGAMTLTFPAEAMVIANGKTRLMLTDLPHGDCNLCHTTLGAFAAPGRIQLP